MTAKRRVLHLVSGDLWAGAEVMVSTLFEALAADPDVELAALCFNHGVLSRKLEALGCDVHVIAERAHNWPAIVAAACARFRRSGIDVIHSHRVKQHLLAALLSKALGVPSVMATIHGLPEALHAHGRRRVTDRAKPLVERQLVRRAFRTVVVVSRDMQDRLKAHDREMRGELIRIYNGIRIPEAPPTTAREPRRVVGSVGRLVEVKDYELFLATAAEIARVDPSVSFRILGDGPERTSLVERATALGLGAQFAILPVVEDPLPFYRSLDLYLNTSVHEGLPLSILEAMACERAVVAPAVGGIPEIIQSGDSGQGLLAAARDPAVLARCCLDLLDDPARRAAMGQRGRERVMCEFSADRMAQAYKATYLQ
jgi:glycosyltransferase involved in cell wall biosynthesis